ncbi:unnamed protein product, partial [Oikopleura dioica]
KEVKSSIQVRKRNCHSCNYLIEEELFRFENYSRYSKRSKKKSRSRSPVKSSRNRRASPPRRSARSRSADRSRSRRSPKRCPVRRRSPSRERYRSRSSRDRSSRDRDRRISTASSRSDYIRKRSPLNHIPPPPPPRVPPPRVPPPPPKTSSAHLPISDDSLTLDSSFSSSRASLLSHSSSRSPSKNRDQAAHSDHENEAVVEVVRRSNRVRSIEFDKACKSLVSWSTEFKPTQIRSTLVEGLRPGI